MPELVSPHPDIERLCNFSLGRLADESEVRVIAAHIDTCGECLAALETIAGDTVENLIRAAETSDDDCAVDAVSGRELREIPEPLREHPRYEITGCLGEGGMGSVFRARHKLMDRDVALKVIHPRLLQNTDAVDRFGREVKAAARLCHPNIVTAYDAEQAGDLHLLVMEFIPGESLEQLVRRRGPLPVDEACEYVRQAALGLDHAHQRGMVHRDIKPANLMITLNQMPSDSDSGERGDRATLKILDFGLARLASELGSSSSLTGHGAVLGTPDFLSPEQAEDAHRADIRADIYSLGCTFYFLLTGQSPFPTGTIMQKLRAHMVETPRPVVAFRSDVPAQVVQLLERMLAKDPVRRIQTPGEVAQELSAILNRAGDQQWTTRCGDGSGQPLGPAADRPADQARRDRRLVRLALVAFASLVLVLLGYFSSGHIVRIVTNKGTIVIKSDAPQLEVAIKDDQGTVIDRISNRTFTFKAGEVDMEVTVKDAAGEQRFVTARFTLTRNGTRTVDARWEVAQTKRAAELKHEKSDPTRYTWPSDKLMNGEIAAPRFDAKPILDEDFSNPKKRLVGFERSTESFDHTFADNRFVVTYKQSRPVAFSGIPAANVNRAFALEVTAHATGMDSDGWGVAILHRQEPERAVTVKIARDGSLRLEGWYKNPLDFPGGNPHSFIHPAVRRGDEDNTLMLILQGQQLEIYVNGAAVCDPLAVDQDMLPAVLLIMARPDHLGATAVFKRVTLWSAEQLPTMEKRGGTVN